MIRNRYFKSTLGVPSEPIIAQTIDASNSPSAGTAATSVNTVTIAGTPTAGDTLVFNVGGYIYTYTVGAGDTTAAAAATAANAVLSANVQGFTVTHTGTTSASFTFTAPVGTSFNGVTVTATEGGNTFSSIVTANFAGGVNPVVGFQSTYKDFVASAAAGSLAAYWEDNKTAVTYGSTANPANVGRKYFYAWKQGDGTDKRSTSLEVPVDKKTSVPYFAGQADIYTLALTGTVSVGQTLEVRILDTTATIIPYPSWEFQVVSSGTINTDIAALRDKINAETVDKVFTATATTNTLTITFSDKSRTFKILYSLETTAAAPTDASVYVITHTQKQKSEIGTYADIKELEKYFITQQGGVTYSGDGHTNPEEFGAISTNVVTGITWGVLIIKSSRHERGEVRDFKGLVYVIIAVPTASLATLAGL